MKTNWNYSTLAKPYINRPAYAEDALRQVWNHIGADGRNLRVCDVGAGIGHLTIPMVEKGFSVDAVEPNDQMRELGKHRTINQGQAKWYEGTGEATGRDGNVYDLVTFGSSFNVTDRPKALQETHRILKNEGWFVCLWNHRDLEDQVQKEIEGIIKSYIPNYSYGSRREDQTKIIEASGLFSDVRFAQGGAIHSVPKQDWVEAWRSHATLARQANDNFENIVKDIEAYVSSFQKETVQVPYTTRIWFAQKRRAV